jgi:PAS domain S-box-containing protein
MSTAANAPPEPKANILLVDDQPANLLALEAILQDLGQNLITALSGDEALRRLLLNDFAVILLDVQMHGLDGFETARLIRSRARSRHTPIIFVTAYESPAFPVGQAYALGAVDFLIKPLVPEILKAKVAGFVDLFRKTEQVKRQAELLRELDRKEFERQLAEEKLRQTEEGFGLLVDRVKDYGICMLDPQGHIITWNAGAARIYGYLDADILGRHFACFYPDDARHSKPERELKVATAEGRCEDEGWRVRRDGTRFWANIVLTALRDHGGRLRGFGKVTRDDTERMQAQARLERSAADLARSNRELEQFAYVASHDLKEPLRKVRIYLERLQRHCQGRLDAEAERLLVHAVEGAGRMRTLINDLLVYARVGSPGKPLEPTDSAAACAHAVANLEAAIRESSAEVTYAGLPVVRADGTELMQLFQNLISNALKFRGAQPPAVRVEARRQDANWVFAIHDNGIGIDPRYAERVFVLFERLHGRQEYPGTGIGLAICKKIVERHGGRIWLESEVGKGATFWFTLPADGGDER